MKTLKANCLVIGLFGMIICIVWPQIYWIAAHPEWTEMLMVREMWKWYIGAIVSILFVGYGAT